MFTSTKPALLACAIALFSHGLPAQSLEIQGVQVDDSAVMIDHSSDPSLYYILDRVELDSDVSTGVAMGLGVPGTGRLVDPSEPPASGFYQVRAYPRADPMDSDLDGMDDVYELSTPELNPLDPADAAMTTEFDGGNTTALDAYLNNYKVGRGMHDVTGQAMDGGMMGYAEGAQKSTGIHDRQWARAFIVRDRKPPYRRAVFVVVDSGQLFHSVTQGVFDKIREDDDLKDHYSFENIVLSATHTHGGAGGYSHHFLFNASIGGFSWRTYDAMVHGIFMAIKKADRDLESGSITRNSGLLDNANENRRPDGFNRNVEHQYPAQLGNPFGSDNRDTEMLALRFEQFGQGEVAMFNWFPVHGVSVSKENTLLTGDNKGNAAYLFEKEMGAIYPEYPGYDPDASTFVAGFANSNPGDLTANRRAEEAPWPENGADDYGRATTIGGRQFEKALALFNDTTRNVKVTGSIDYRHEYVDFSDVAVNPSELYPYNVPGVAFPDSLMGLFQPFNTCVGALGFEFAKGTKDGEALSQGAVDALILAFPTDPVTSIMEICQYPKDIIITTTGAINLTPQVLPISILKIGDLAILAVPAEFTVMAGHRLRRTVEQAFADEGQSVRAVLAGLSNSYSGYVTTFEEYVYQDTSSGVPNQGYEAASTHFGAFTLAAYQTKFAELARSMAQGTDEPGAPSSDSIPASARTADPVVVDPIPFLDSAPPAEVVAATYHEPAGCPTGQFWDVGTGDCWSCPPGYTRTVFPIVNLISGEPTNNGCEEDPVFSSATYQGQAGCSVGQFIDIGTGACWSCPAGFERSVLPIVDLISGDPSSNGCRKPPSYDYTSANTATATGGTDCPSGYVYDFILGRCYKCPSGYSKVITRAWNNGSACEKSVYTSANSAGGTGFLGTDCSSGYVYDFILGRCYKCPSGYSKRVSKAWNSGSACTKKVSTAADNTTSSGGTDCPSGYVYDFILGKCYKCPSGYNKYILAGWDKSNACEKVNPEQWTAATRYGSATCPSGQIFDIGLGSCWTCPSGFGRTIFAVDGTTACQKTTPALVAATRFGKYHCDQRNPNWFLDIGRGECWSCPSGAWRNLNAVDSGLACNVPRPFGTIRSAPSASYSTGSTVLTSFWAGHPGNVFGTDIDRLVDAVPSFLKVQKQSDGGEWETVKTDADWDTSFEWERTEGSGAATVKWVIPTGTPTGTYRVTHTGYSGDLLFGVTPYDGTSPEFQVNE